MNRENLIYRSFFICWMLYFIFAGLNKISFAQTDADKALYDKIDTYILQQKESLHIPGASLAVLVKPARMEKRLLRTRLFLLARSQNPSQPWP